MSARRVISLAGGAWTVRALHVESIVFPPGAERGCRPEDAAYEPADYLEDLARGVPAVVPGCVHQALIAADMIHSPDRGDAEERLQWMGRTEWEYRCEFEGVADPQCASHDPRDDHVELVLDGLDTVATIELNGVPIGEAASFYFPHRFDVKDSIRIGRNELSIRFTPPLVHIRAEESRLGARPYNGDEAKGGVAGGWDPFIFIRKPACNLGWDWGPKVATVGVAGGGGGVWIERWTAARIEHVRPLVMRADAEIAEVRVHVDAVMPAHIRGGEEPHIDVTLRAPGDGGEVVAHSRGVFTPDDRSHASVLLGITRPDLWWPRGYGPQAPEDERPLYHFHVELRDGDRVLDTWKGQVGLRTVELDTSPDNWGSAFTLRINGQPVFCMGANWIPEGLFAGYAAEDVIRERVRDAAAMNANMLRVWGGGLYEPSCFYDECDKRGVMAWQDFMFACGLYPEEAPFGGAGGLVEREARHQVARLSAHASVVLWCGGNETIWGHDKWGWRERLLEGQSWGSGYWLEMLPRVCGEVDPSRPYWPNSPWSGVDASGAQRDVLDADHGDRHTWEVDAWGPRPETEGFRSPTPSGVPRFCSEFGHQSPPCIETLNEQLRGIELPLDVRAQPEITSGTVAPSGDDIEQKLDATIRELARRQRGPGGDERWYHILPVPDGSSEPGEFERWHRGAQGLQASYVERGIRWHRVNRPRCGGVLFWQLNDCWAGHSWSAIDVAGRRKPLWEMARRAMSPRLLSIHVVDGSPMLYAVNDTDRSWEGEVSVTIENRAHATLGEKRVYARVGPRTAGVIDDLGEWVKSWIGGPWDLRFVRALAADESGFGPASLAWMPGLSGSSPC